MHRDIHGQSGAVLFIGLIMLLLVTLLAVAAMRMATTNVQIVGNEQFRAEAKAAANFALDQEINNQAFTDAAGTTTEKVSLTRGDSLAADAKALSVTVSKPDCKRYRFIKKSELVSAANTVQPQDVPCFTGQSSSGLTLVDASVIGNTAENSLCATSLWDVQASVMEPASGASVTVSQGIEVRMEMSDAENKCK